MIDLFKNKKFNTKKLLRFGFKQVKEGFIFSKPLYDEQFELTVLIDNKGDLSTRLVELDTGELYTLHLVESADGSFVGQIKDEYNTILEQISEACCESKVFKSNTTNEIIEYIRNKYGVEPEFLWNQYPDAAVVRRKDNSKWYAAFMTIPKSKLGFSDRALIEIIDLKVEQATEVVDNKTIFPGYHMNKKYWITIILDDSVPVDEIKTRIEESYRLAGKKK